MIIILISFLNLSLRGVSHAEVNILTQRYRGNGGGGPWPHREVKIGAPKDKNLASKDEKICSDDVCTHTNKQKMNLYERNQKDGLFDRKTIQKICKFAACVVPLHFDSPLPNRTWRGREK